VPSLIQNVKPKPIWLNDEIDFRQRGVINWEQKELKRNIWNYNLPLVL
jgi:hypothetical protein